MVQVLDARAGVITNFEVAQLLAAQQQARNDEEAALPLPGARRTQAGGSGTAWHTQQSAATISEQVIAYLEQTCCASQTQESITAFLDAAAPYKLTPAELLSLVNTQPRSTVEIHLLVEECEERLTQEDVGGLLELCEALSPGGRTETGAADQ